MRDEMDGRIWDAHGQQFSNDLHRLLTGTGAALRRLKAEAKPILHSSPTGRSRAGQA
ncbi:MAG TPA: hypothetical protein VGB48_07390 [Allosphingosinicella sp.]|jgi:hypothetical protein